MSDAPVSLANALSDRYTIERLLGYGGMATGLYLRGRYAWNKRTFEGRLSTTAFGESPYFHRGSRLPTHSASVPRSRDWSS